MGKITGYTTKPGSAEILLESRATSKFSTSKLKKFGLKGLLDTGNTHGVRQGGPLSPLLLNLYLHHFLDEPWRRNWASIPMIRVADDILLACRTKKEAEQARAGLRELLRPAGMPLKSQKEGTVHDLRKGEVATWLGFAIGKGQKALTVRIAERAWRRLTEYLTLAHEKPDSPIRAATTIDGWIDQMGPCYPFVKRPRVYEKLGKLAAALGFEEIPSSSATVSRWKRAYKRWCHLREEIKERPEILDSVWQQKGKADAHENGADVNDKHACPELYDSETSPFDPD